MSFRRREVLAILGLGAVSCAGSAPATAPKQPLVTEKKQKRILILGGTGFIGPKTVEVALARGHHVTIFNRGKREKLQPLEPAVEHLVDHLFGNRDPEKPADEEHPEGSPKGLEQLLGKSWDVVIDNSGYFPRMVAASAKLLADHAKHYIYISSISAYAENPAKGGDEDTRLAKLADPTVEEMGDQFQNYGGLKVLCEQAAAAAFPNRCAIVRPGYIVGPGDPTDRFTYWPVRIAKGGDVLAPGTPDDPLQWIDVRDLAAWLVTLAEHETTGTFNAIGPNPPARWGDVLDTCVRATGSAAKLVWVPQDWLAAHDMGEDGAFPIWSAPVGELAGFHRWSNKRAVAAGLTLRTIDDTVKAIVAWYPGEIERRIQVAKEVEPQGKKAQGDPSALRATPKKDDQEVLAQWKAK